MKKALLLAPMGSVHSRFNQPCINALLELGYHVTLMANFEEDDDMQKGITKFVDSCKEDGIEIISYPFARHSLFRSLRLLPVIKKVLKQGKYDLIHAHTETGGFILRCVKNAVGNSKLVYTPHGMSFYKGSSLKSQLIYRPIEKWIAKKMHANIAMNGEELETFKCWNAKTANFIHGVGIDRECILLRSQMNWTDRETMKIPLDTFLIVSVGELNANKNHEVVIRALARLKEKNFMYMICGVGELKGYLHNLVDQLGLTDKVIFAGYRQDIPTLLKNADLFIFPSFHEGLPVSVMEAMTLGVPIICSEIRGNVDLVENDKNGYLCNPKDENGFFERVKELMENAQKRQAFGNENVKRSALFDKEHVQAELMKIYTGLYD